MEFSKLDKALHVTGLAFIMSEIYDTLVLTSEEADKVGRITSKEFSVDYDNITEEDAVRIKDYITIQIQALTKELFSEEEPNDNSLPVSE
jgi:hypothetical protein